MCIRDRKGAGKPTLRIGVTFSMDQFWSSPATYGASNREVNTEQAITHATIFHMTPAGKIAPGGLAATWKKLSGKNGPNKNFEFTLRQNAKFADGSVVDAKAVVSWLNWFAKNNSNYAALLGPKPSFKAVGKWTVRVTLTTPLPGFFDVLSDGGQQWGFVSSPKCVADMSLFSQGQCGAGPFKLVPSQSVKGDHYTYVPNPGYYDAKNVKWGGVTMKVIPVATSLLQALQAGQLDVVAAGNDTSAVPVAKSAGQKIYWASTGALIVILHANGKPASPITDLRVRQAMNYAIDRAALAKALFLGLSVPTSEYVTSDGYDLTAAKMYPYDVAKAKQLMAQAGYANGFSFTMYTANPQQVTFMQAIGKYWDAIGIKMNITLAPPSLGFSILNLAPATIVQFSGETTTAAYQRWISPASAINMSGDDPTANALYYTGLKSKNPSVAWKKLWVRATDQAYFAPVCTLPLLYYSTPNVSGIFNTRGRAGTVLVTEMYPK